MNLTWIMILLVTAVVSWLLSGLDHKVTGQDKTADFVRRGVRCSVTLVLVGFGALLFMNGGVPGAFIALLLMLPLGLFWSGCISELFARIFHQLVDSEDHRRFDPKQVTRDLNRLAVLVREGRNDEAVELCKQLLESSEVSTMTVETMLFQLYREMYSTERLAALPSMVSVRQLCEQRRFDEAADRLEALLKKEPQNLNATFLLIEIYARDLQRPAQAMAVLQKLARLPHVPPSFIEYVRNCVREWGGVAPPKPKIAESIESLLVGSPGAAPGPKVNTDTASVDELLASGHLATAIELLEKRIREQPQDFESSLKLAEAYGVYCRDLSRASKCVDRIATDTSFSPQQVQLAKSKLKEWKSHRGA